MTTSCCAECGVEGGASLKICKPCMQVKYCNAECQRNHWPTHKTACKHRAAELRDVELFKDPPPKEDCPICFLPMPEKLICCVLLPPATRSSVPIYDFAIAHEELTNEDTALYYSCCGKTICRGCIYSFYESGNNKCPFCNSDRARTTHEERVGEVTKRAEANDAASIFMLARYYYKDVAGIQHDRTRAMELFTKSAGLGFSKAHNRLGGIYHEGGDVKKAKFHVEAAAMAGNEGARFNVGIIEAESGNMERALKHWIIAASAGHYKAMFQLKIGFEIGLVSRESIDSTVEAYNSSCAEMRSEARDAASRIMAEAD